MQKKINIGGKEILMEANGATPRIYRRMFGSDLLTTLHGAVSKDGEVINIEVFENLAYCMAKQAGSVEDDIDTWLGSFDSSMAIVDAIGELMALWRGNTATTVNPKKKANRQTGQ